MSKEQKNTEKQGVLSSVANLKPVQTTTTELEQLKSKIESLESSVKSLKEQLAWYKNLVFGSKSEKRILGDITAPSQQISIFDVIEEKTGTSLPPIIAPEPEKIKVVYSRKRKKTPKANPIDSLLEFDESVEVEEVLLPNLEIANLSPDQYEIIDYEVSYKLSQTPAAYGVVKYIRPVTKILADKKITTSPMPPMVVERSFFDVSLTAGMLVDKVKYHIPLFRQHQRIADCGIRINRNTLVSHSNRSLEMLEPIYKAQAGSVLSSDVVAMDDTWMKVGLSAPGKMHKGYFWPIINNKNEIIFPYTATRKDSEVPAILRDYKGTLLTDGHEAYQKHASQTPGLIHALCWVHTRRNFFELETPLDLRAEALNQIGEIYKLEDQIKQLALNDEQKLQFRQQKSRPLVEKFFEWLEQLHLKRCLLPEDKFTKAVYYALKRRVGLEVFLSNPRVSMDTNHLERALRGIPMGRRNHLFCWSELGAKCLGIAHSLIRTCMLNDINPYTYLVDVFQRIQTHPQSRVHELTPVNWKVIFADKAMPSPMELAKLQKLEKLKSIGATQKDTRPGYGAH